MLSRDASGTKCLRGKENIGPVYNCSETKVVNVLYTLLFSSSADGHPYVHPTGFKTAGFAVIHYMQAVRRKEKQTKAGKLKPTMLKRCSWLLCRLWHLWDWFGWCARCLTCQDGSTVLIQLFWQQQIAGSSSSMWHHHNTVWFKWQGSHFVKRLFDLLFPLLRVVFFSIHYWGHTIVLLKETSNLNTSPSEHFKPKSSMIFIGIIGYTFCTAKNNCLSRMV